MNYMPYIVNYLSSIEEIAEIYLAPGAFITEKRGNRLIKVSDAILTPEDIRDTLVSLRSHTPFAAGPIGKEGRFSFGVKDVGRFGVNYITQRGSYVVHILRTPYNIPLLGKICPDKDSINRMEEIVRLHTSGLVAFQGRNQAIVNTLVYSFLQHICNNYSKVIFILESPLSFLLKHGQSLVLQRELGVDVETLEEALKDAFHMNSDILYIRHRDILPSKEQDRMLRAIESYSLVLLSLPTMEVSFFKELEGRLKALVEVELDEGGAFRCTFKEPAPQALKNH